MNSNCVPTKPNYLQFSCTEKKISNKFTAILAGNKVGKQSKKGTFGCPDAIRLIKSPGIFGEGGEMRRFTAGQTP
jgi:hypothetical protein